LPWWQRPSVWALVAGAVIVVIYFASMGAAGPWDPWETHYGEVARQMLVRHDPVDLYWQGGNGGPDGNYENTFWSKPALPFWLMALSMKIFGVGTSADPAEMVQGFWPELAIRLPSMLAGMTTCVFLGWVLWRLVSPRAGVLAAIVLATMPQWAIVTRQALTDMFFVGPVVLAAGAWAMAWMQPDRELRRRGSGWKSVPWDRAYVAFMVMLVLFVIVPLAVIHQHSFDPVTWDRVGKSKKFAAGLRDIQSHMAIYWVLLAVVLAVSARWKRRSQAWMGILYIAGGISLIGKGMIGPGLIGLVVLVHLIVSKRWRLLLVCGLPTGIVLFALAGFPWHHAMLLYRGEKFYNELIVVNNLQRFSTGEQKQAIGGFAYYLETLGLGALPWAALTPLALWAGVQAFSQRIIGKSPEPESEPDVEPDDEPADKPDADSDPDEPDPESESESEPEPEPDPAPSADAAETEAVESDDPPTATSRFMLLWLLAALFTLSFSATKYYHYLVPCLPPLAAVMGIWLDRVLAGKSRTSPAANAIGAVLAIAIVLGVLRDLEAEPSWLAHLTTYLYTGMWTKGGPDPELAWWTCAPFIVGLLAWLVSRYRVAVAAFVFSSVLTTAWVIDDYVPAASENWSQRSMIQVYFDNKTEHDRFVSWWFYYRGETFLTKKDLWVMKDHNPKKLREFMQAYAEEHAGQGASIWVATVTPHIKRLKSQLPLSLREGYEVMYESFHYTLVRIRIP